MLLDKVYFQAAFNPDPESHSSLSLTTETTTLKSKSLINLFINIFYPYLIPSALKAFHVYLFKEHDIYFKEF